MWQGISSRKIVIYWFYYRTQRDLKFMTSIRTFSKDTWALFLLIIAIAIVIVSTIYIVPKLGAENWNRFVAVCHTDGGTINDANQCIIPVTDHTYISRRVSGFESYCTLPTRACGLHETS